MSGQSRSRCPAGSLSVTSLLWEPPVRAGVALCRSAANVLTVRSDGLTRSQQLAGASTRHRAAAWGEFQLGALAGHDWPLALCTGGREPWARALTIAGIGRHPETSWSFAGQASTADRNPWGKHVRDRRMRKPTRRSRVTTSTPSSTKASPTSPLRFVTPEVRVARRDPRRRRRGRERRGMLRGFLGHLRTCTLLSRTSSLRATWSCCDSSSPRRSRATCWGCPPVTAKFTGTRSISTGSRMAVSARSGRPTTPRTSCTSFDARPTVARLTWTASTVGHLLAIFWRYRASQRRRHPCPAPGSALSGGRSGQHQLQPPPGELS